MKNISLLTFASISVLSLSACTSTWEGLKNDFGVLKENVSETTGKVASKTGELATKAKTTTQNTVSSFRSSNPLCPEILVDPSLDSITEFYDPAKMDQDQIISTLTLMSTSADCQKNGDLVAMEINLNFEGNTGPKAKRKDGDQPFFSYPYYVAVKDIDGVELSKEIFAAGITYENNKTGILHTETIRQRLPIKNGKAPYMIEVGFQLTPEQLAYNTAQQNKL